MIAVLTIMLLSGTISQAGQVGDPPKTEPPAEELIMGTATISPNIWGTICTSAEVTFWVYVSGCPGPYTINLLINNNPVSVTVQNSPYVLTLIVNSSLYVVLQSVTAPGCNITVTQPNFFWMHVMCWSLPTCQHLRCVDQVNQAGQMSHSCPAGQLGATRCQTN